MTIEKGISKKDAVKALKNLLEDHDRIYGEYTLFNKTDDSFDKEEIEQWKAERKALVMAIKCIEKQIGK